MDAVPGRGITGDDLRGVVPGLAGAVQNGDQVKVFARRGMARLAEPAPST